MNTMTGKTYEGPAAVNAAVARGENLVEVDPAVAKRLGLQRQVILNLKRQQRRELQAARAAKKKHQTRKRERVAKASRKRNR